MLKSSRLEHAIDEFSDLGITETVVGASDLNERTQHLRQFNFIDDAVAIVVTHVEDDTQFVFRASFREEHHRVQKLLERNTTITVLVNDVEHHFDEYIIALYASTVTTFESFNF